MEKMLKIEVDGLTGEVTEREMTSDELAQFESDRAAFTAEQAKQQSKVVARESALAKLAALGLTEEEIAAL
jgi:hypothetical protein